MRIAVLGAGSIGCFIGGLWAEAGLDVELIGREAIAGDIASHGLRLTDHGGTEVRLPSEKIPFSTSSETLGRADLILLTVKSTATQAAASSIARHARPEAAVLSLQNGISNIDLLRQALPGRKVLRGLVGFNVAYLGAGRWHKGTSGILAAERDPILVPLADRLAGHPGRLALAEDMVSLAWGKLILNLNNAVNALSGRTLLAELSDRTYRRVLAASMNEALDVLDAAGTRPAKVGALPPRLIPSFLRMPDFVFNAIGLRLQKIDERARSSMADDFAAGRPTEIDFLNGEIITLAQQLGRKAPVNAAIIRLVKAAEAGGRRTFGPDELASLVLK